MANPDRSTPQRAWPGRSDQWLWALLSFVGWIAATAATLPVASAISPPSLVRVDLAVWMVLTVLISLVVVLVSARVVFGVRLRVSPVAIVVSVIGVSLAVVEELLLHEWAGARFGYYDADLVWWTASLSGLVIATTIASFGTLVAPRGARLAPLVCQAVGAVAIVLVLATNVEGLADGIRPQSVPLAIAMGLCGLFAVGVTLGSILAGRARRQGETSRS